MGGTDESAPAASPAQRAYFEALEQQALKVLEVARAARSKGLDPSMDVEIPLAADLAARVEAQVQIPGVARRIRELTRQYRGRELVAIHCAREVAQGRFRTWPGREVALEKAVRTGLSILTEGILVAPLEGIARVSIGKNADATDYADLYFAGPIRSAGGTAQAMSVLIADVVRRDLGIGRFHCNQAEVERYREEVPAYKRAQHLQYAPGPEEIELIVRNCPVCVNGEGTEQEEVTGHRDLPRVETNRLRGGAVLVLAEGLSLKAAKIAKIVAQLQLPEWGFLETLARRTADRAPTSGGSNGADLEPSDKFIQELIGGRPVLAHPSRIGGFRLRYGRSRTAGLASTSISPVTMHAVDEFLAVGTQMKIERPGKGTIVTPCSDLEGPILLLRNGDLVQPATVAAYREIAAQVVQITDLGEILIPYGEFLENNAALAEAGFTPDWWRAEVEAVGGEAAVREAATSSPTFDQAVEWSARWNVPLHPAHNLFWHDVAWPDYLALGQAVSEATLDARGLSIPKSGPAKSALIGLGALHTETADAYRVEERWEALAHGCGFRPHAGRLVPHPDRASVMEGPPAKKWPALAAAARLTDVGVKPRAPTRIGARMGRPEKADKRTMDPPVHVLFPVGHEGGVQRSVEEATTHRIVQTRVGVRGCAQCGRKTYLVQCVCGTRTEPTGAPPQDMGILVREDFQRSLRRLGGIKAPKKVKGVQGLISAAKTPEALEKGVLRALHDVWVFKDGTIRFDATDAPLTHFRPAEIRTSVAQLRQLGYDRDARGDPLERNDQVVELRVQDVVLPEAAGPYFVQAAAFVDDLLQRYYGLAPFFQVQTSADLVGHLVAGLAPHTSGAVLGRIIGFTKAQVGYAHPYYHTAKRRNCVVGTTELFILNSAHPRRFTLQELYDSVKVPERLVDRFGTRAKHPRGLRVFAVNPKTGRVGPRPVRRLYRMPAPAHLVRLETRTGRVLTCSPDHRVPVWKGGRIHKLKVSELKPGVRALFVARLPIRTGPPPEVDLLRELQRHPLPGVMLRGTKGWLSRRIHELGGLATAARRLGIRKKSLDNFRRRNSLPWEAAARLLRLKGWRLDRLPTTIRLAVARDTVELPRFLRLNREAMRLFGYYLAEGHARAKPREWYQISIAAQDPAIVRDVLRCVRATLGLRIRHRRVSLTISSRLVHHVFTRILGLGAHARDKRIPWRLASLSPRLTRELLRAYFAGDGSVETGRLHVQCHSTSQGLLRDVGLQLATRGIAYRIKHERRRAGGAVREFLARKGRPQRFFESHSISIRSNHALAFGKRIGFFLPRKQRALESAYPKIRRSRLERGHGNIVLDPIVRIVPVAPDSAWLYDLEVAEHHNYLIAHQLVSSNCDGDEDAYMLLLDAFLNFSRSFIPERRGGLMDLPLVLATRIDPSEIDKEAQNLDVGWTYPLELFRAAEKHLPAKEIAPRMDLVAHRLGTPRQYEGFGYTAETRLIHEGPLDSRYKTLETMPEKMAAQLALADRLRGVDGADVAARVITHHLLPDLIGNLKAFAKQSVRCTKCNTKYRRMPLSGRCTRRLGTGKATCDNLLTLTVHQASVRKYMDLCVELAERYEIPEYTRQHIRLVQKFIDDSFRTRETKLAAFG